MGLGRPGASQDAPHHSVSPAVGGPASRPRHAITHRPCPCDHVHVHVRWRAVCRDRVSHDSARVCARALGVLALVSSTRSTSHDFHRTRNIYTRLASRRRQRRHHSANRDGAMCCAAHGATLERQVQTLVRTRTIQHTSHPVVLAKGGEHAPDRMLHADAAAERREASWRHLGNGHVARMRPQIALAP